RIAADFLARTCRRSFLNLRKSVQSVDESSVLRIRAYPRHPRLKSLFWFQQRFASLHETCKEKLYPQIFKIAADFLARAWRRSFLNLRKSAQSVDESSLPSFRRPRKTILPQIRSVELSPSEREHRRSQRFGEVSMLFRLIAVLLCV